MPLEEQVQARMLVFAPLQKMVVKDFSWQWNFQDWHVPRYLQ